jgi:HEAT repeat protein
MKPIASVLKIHTGEGQVVALMIAMMSPPRRQQHRAPASMPFFALWGAISPYVYILLGVVTFINLMGMTALMGRVCRSRLYRFIPLVLAIALLFSRLILFYNPGWFYPVLYVIKDVLNALQGLVLWGIASAMLDTRQAKRLFPLLIAGSISGATIGSFSTPLLVNAFGAENMLLVWATALLAAAGLIWKLIRANQSRLEQSAQPARYNSTKRTRKGEFSAFFTEIQRGYQYVRRSDLMGLWAIASVLFSILWFSLLLPFSRSATLQYPNTDTLASFFGVFQGLQTGLALVISLLITNRLFARFGVMNMLLVYPAIYFTGFAAMALFPIFPVIAGSRFLHMTWGQGVAEPAWYVSFNTIPAERRDQVRAFLQAVPGQAGIVMSGLILVIGDQALQPRQLYLDGLAAAALCMLVVWRAKKAYSGALAEALRSGRPQVFFAEEEPFGGFRQDAASQDIIREGLQSPEPGIRRLSVEILGQLPGSPAISMLAEVLSDTDPEVRIAALRTLAKLEAVPAIPQVIPYLDDETAEIRRQAILTLQTLSERSLLTLAPVRPLLDDPDPAVRTCAAIALVEAGDPDPLQSILLPIAADPQPEARAQAMLALGECWPSAAHWQAQILGCLSAGISDPIPDVRRATATALQIPTAAGIQLLVQLLGDEDTSVRSVAAVSLGALGDCALTAAIDALKQPSLEGGALIALEHLPTGQVTRDLEMYTLHKVTLAQRDHSLATGFNPKNGARMCLLVDSLLARARQHALHALHAVSLFDDRRAVHLAIDNLSSRDAAQYAYALEILDTIHSAPMIRPLFLLWEAGEPPAVPSAPAGWIGRPDPRWHVVASHNQTDPKITHQRAAAHDADVGADYSRLGCGWRKEHGNHANTDDHGAHFVSAQGAVVCRFGTC